MGVLASEKLSGILDYVFHLLLISPNRLHSIFVLHHAEFLHWLDALLLFSLNLINHLFDLFFHFFTDQLKIFLDKVLKFLFLNFRSELHFIGDPAEFLEPMFPE